MKRFFGLIGLIIVFAGAGYYYFNYKNTQNPEKIFDKAVTIPGADQARNYIADKVKNWKPDPEDPQVRIPKNWGRSEMAVDGKTFAVFSPDSATPPRYYVSFAFPKSLIAKTPLIKCWGTDAKKSTDVCIVGNDPKMEAYFKLLKFLKAPSFEGLVSTVEMN